MPGIENFKVDDASQAHEVAVGDRVRSFDFEWDNDCYVEGTVTGIGLMLEGCERVTISADVICRDGVRLRVTERNYYPPVNGTRSIMGGYTNGIRRIHTAEEWREILRDHAEDLAG